MKCKECGYKRLCVINGGPNRFYCDHPDARFARSECEPTPMICRTKRHSKELTIKTAPKWCPFRKNNGEKIEVELSREEMVGVCYAFCKEQKCLDGCP